MLRFNVRKNEINPQKGQVEAANSKWVGEAENFLKKIPESLRKRVGKTAPFIRT